MTKSKAKTPSFRFDPELSVNDNVLAFLSEMDTRNHRLAEIFRQNISKMIPLPADQQARSAARVAFNAAVIAALTIPNSK